jgi:tetratricopeptide (TPR) repeat protein
MSRRLASARRALRGLAIAGPGLMILGAARFASAQEPQAPSAVAVVPEVPKAATSSEPDEPLARARVRSSAGDHLFLAGHYAAALAEYSRAYDILEGHPKQYWVLHNLAACNERMFRYDVAVGLYEEYLRRAPPNEQDRAEVTAIVGTLRSLLATLVIESSVAGEVWLDDRRLGTAPGTWNVPAGSHILEVHAERYESERREVTLNAGQRHVDRFQLRRLSMNAGPQPGYFWVAAGLTGVAVIVGTTAGFEALSARERGRDRAALYLDTQPDAQRTRRWALASDAGFGAALLFGATATVLYFVTDWPNATSPTRREPAARSGRSLSFALAAPGHWGATLAGRF